MPTDPPDGYRPLPDVDGFITHVGPLYVRWTEDSASLAFRVAQHHANPAGMCHGGMLMTLMDMGIAVGLKVAAKSEMFLPTINLSFDFLAPAHVGDWLESEVSFTFTTPRMGFAHGLLIGPNGPVVRANGIMKIPKADDARFQTASRRVGNLKQDG